LHFREHLKQHLLILLPCKCPSRIISIIDRSLMSTSRNKGFGFLPQMAFAPDLARTGAKRGH
jgi:hypothetical protein